MRLGIAAKLRLALLKALLDWQAQASLAFRSNNAFAMPRFRLCSRLSLYFIYFCGARREMIGGVVRCNVQWERVMRRTICGFGFASGIVL